MLKSVLFSAIAIASIGTLQAQEQKKTPGKEKDYQLPKGPPARPTPALVYDTSGPGPQIVIKRGIMADTMSRATRIRLLTDATYRPGYNLIASHRAQWNGQDQPENSMDAIIHVSGMDAVDIIELDIKKSSNDSVYVMHDNYLQRTTDFLDKFLGIGQGSDGYGHYNNYTWLQVKTLTLKMPDFTYTDDIVPLFREVLRYVKFSTRKLINLDIGDMAVFRKTWDVVQQEDAFDVCIFKTAQLTVEQFKQQYYDPLPSAQKAKVIFFPMIVANPSGYNSPMAQYTAWENSEPKLAKGYEIGYRRDGEKENEILDVVDAIHTRRRVRVHVFNTLPDNYEGRYIGNVNINQCCNTAYDSRGDWEYLFEPRPGTVGVDGYIITDDPETLAGYMER